MCACGTEDLIGDRQIAILGRKLLPGSKSSQPADLSHKPPYYYLLLLHLLHFHWMFARLISFPHALSHDLF